MPVLFVSHGAPTIVLDRSPAQAFLRSHAATLPRPRAILVISAHFERAGPTLTSGHAPPTIHDFGRGFPAALFAMRYRAPGDPVLAAAIAERLRAAGFAPRLDPEYGFDHGVWTPLALLYPDADIPVIALSIDPHQGPRAHHALGAALAPLREEGLLIIGSGAVTHNLGAFFRGGFALDAPAPDWVRAFADWLASAIAEGRVEDVLEYRARAPFARENHPTEDHVLPLFVALGAGGGQGARVHASTAHAILAMDVYAF